MRLVSSQDQAAAAAPDVGATHTISVVPHPHPTPASQQQTEAPQNWLDTTAWADKLCSSLCCFCCCCCCGCCCRCCRRFRLVPASPSPTRLFIRPQPHAPSRRLWWAHPQLPPQLLQMLWFVPFLSCYCCCCCCRCFRLVPASFSCSVLPHVAATCTVHGSWCAPPPPYPCIKTADDTATNIAQCRDAN